MIGRASILALSLAACGGIAGAGELRSAELTDALPGRPGLTYQALLTQVMPDLQADADGVWSTAGIKGLRTLDGTDDGMVPLSFRSVEALEIESDGKPVLLVATDGEDEFSMILAAFDMSVERPRLIDTVDAGLDRWTALGSTLTLAGGTEAFAVTGSHDNSSESFNATALAFLHGGKLTPIANVLAYGARTCGWMTTQEAGYETRPDPGSRYAAIALTVTQETTKEDEDCTDGSQPLAPLGTQTFTDVYRWDDAKGAYASPTNNLAQAVGPE